MKHLNYILSFKSANFKYSIVSLSFFTLIVISSCKKFVTVPLPIDQLTSDFVFANDNSAIEAVTGIYSKMMENQQQFSSGFTTFFAGMSSDELYYFTPSFRDEFVNNQITLVSHSSIESSFWNPCYLYIYASNKCIESVNASKSLSPEVKKQVIGEAKFIRAFCYFHLVNLFGDVPLALTSVYQDNQSLSRNKQSVIYTQIIDDLKDAENMLSEDYPSSERARPNKLAAAAFLSRVYLYCHDWAGAGEEASKVINSGLYSLDSNLNSVFKINSNETIWQLRPVNPYVNTWEGKQIIPATSGSTPTYLLTNSLINSFEINDRRKTEWVKSTSFLNQTLYYPYKYKIYTGSTLSEYYVVLRLAEQYLIRAEARCRQNNISGTQSDINIIRNRAGLNNTIANNQSSLLAAIEHERQIELFAEWGHRWFDLKRTKRADYFLGALKPSTWQSTDTLWPIPESQIRLNPSLKQNPGY